MKSEKADEAAQPEQAAWDVFGSEILPGDEIVIDNITGETVLKENLERYLTESKNYYFFTAR